MITWIYTKKRFIVSSTGYTYIIYKVHCSWVYPSNKYTVFVISILFKKVVLYGSNTCVRPVS